MTALLVGFFVASIAGAAGAVWAVLQAGAARHWNRAQALFVPAAQMAGLTEIAVTEGGFGSQPAVDGRTGPLRVHLATYAEGRHQRGTRVVIEGFGPGAGEISLPPEGLIAGLSGGEEEIGSPFDDEIHLAGGRVALLTLLDAGTRPLLNRLLNGSIATAKGDVPVTARFSGGLLEVKLADDRSCAVPFADVLAAVLPLAKRLVMPADLPSRLAANLASEPEARVRWSILRLLDRAYPGHPLTEKALRAALDDPNDEVRCRVAAASGEAGLDTLLDLVASDTTADVWAARAVTALGERLPVEQAEDTLRRALAREHVRTARACVELLDFRHGRGSEELLLRTLGSNEPELILAAVRALGRLGTVAAVTPLHELAKDRRGEVAGAARQAVAEIQSRLTGAGPGQLTLAASEAGALSLPTDEPGQLTLTGTDPEAGKAETSWARPVGQRDS